MLNYAAEGEINALCFMLYALSSQNPANERLRTFNLMKPRTMCHELIEAMNYEIQATSKETRVTNFEPHDMSYELSYETQHRVCAV